MLQKNTQTLCTNFIPIFKFYTSDTDKANMGICKEGVSVKFLYVVFWEKRTQF